MTYTECVAALTPLDRRVYLLALVAQIAEPCLAHCDEEAVTTVAWTLDATRRWCLGLADEDEVWAAASASCAAYAAASCAAYAAAYASCAAYAAADAASYAAADAAAAVRQRLVDSAHGVTWGHPTPSGYVVGPMHVWVPHDVAWGRWVACAELSPEEAVRADMALEAA